MIVKGSAIELNRMIRLCKRMHHKGSTAVNEFLNSLKESESLVIGVFNRVKRLIIRAVQVALSSFMTVQKPMQSLPQVLYKGFRDFRVWGLAVGVLISRLRV